MHRLIGPSAEVDQAQRDEAHRVTRRYVGQGRGREIAGFVAVSIEQVLWYAAAAVSVAVVAYIVVQTKADRRYLTYAGVSMVLPLLYHIYMFAAGGTLLPASLFTPIITYSQDPASWLQRLPGSRPGVPWPWYKQACEKCTTASPACQRMLLTRASNSSSALLIGRGS